MNNGLTATKHLNDWGFACVNGYKGSIREYLLQQYEAYKQVCVRCDVAPKSFDDWRQGA